MSRPDVVTTVVDLRARLARWRSGGARIALVPTMGALHAGHLALVAAAAEVVERVVVSVFVNPTQFAPQEDLATYPRDLEADLVALGPTQTDLVYAPTMIEMYPEGSATTVSVGGPSEGLESVARPHFFSGVATVVAKLFVQCAPDIAVFGEKDFQQLAVVRQMARDLSLPVDIRAVATVREPDGLAMSSRNVRLAPADRARAPALYKALTEAGRQIAQGGDVSKALDRARRDIEASGLTIDYVELRDSVTLSQRSAERAGRILAAVRIEGVRLIDNVAVRV